jgi:Tfp pilus assembly protein PilF
MSVINKMHQDIREAQKDGPVLGGMPDRSRSKKIIIAAFIVLLVLSAIGFATLIFNKNQRGDEQAIVQTIGNQLTPENSLNKPNESLNPSAEKDLSVVVKEEVVQQIMPLVQHQLSVPIPVTKLPEKKQIMAPVVIQHQDPIIIEVLEPPIEVASKNVSVSDSQVIETQSIDNVLSDDSMLVEKSSLGVLEIKDAQLTNAQLARIKLKEAQSAENEGELNKAADKREQALRFDPSLNDVRKSLSLYFYGTGNVIKAKQLLQTGAVISPDYSEFNLMLSRIALKEGDSQKAYLYLNQHPPVVSGHLDYYVSYAILAQKFHKYEQSERLYSDLLSERPNNGRWLMSLAIAQDKQNKVVLAVANYQRALLEPDLSSNAKAYINQRIAYLEKKQ